MTPLAVGFLGAIALATLLMALIQVGAILYGLRLARRVEQLMQQVEREIKPMIAQLTSVSTDAARASAVAVSQVERLDAMLINLADRLDQTLTMVQRAIFVPAREGVAIVSAIKAAVTALRGLRGELRSRHGRVEEEEALFIG